MQNCVSNMTKQWNSLLQGIGIEVNSINSPCLYLEFPTHKLYDHRDVKYEGLEEELVKIKEDSKKQSFCSRQSVLLTLWVYCDR